MMNTAPHNQHPPQHMIHQQPVASYPSMSDPLPGDEVPVTQATTTVSEPPRQRYMSMKMNDVATAYNHTEETLISNIPIANHPRAKLMFRLALCLTIFDMMCVVIWLLTTPRSYFWPLHIIYCSLILQLFLFIFTGTFERPTKVFSAHSAFSALSIMKLILMNLQTGNYPWAVFPVAILSAVWSIHTLYVVVPVYFNGVTVHSILFTIVNFVLFIVYCYERHRGFPWFLIILVFTAILLAVHVIVHKTYLKKRRERELQQQAVAQQGETVITNIPQQQPVTQQPPPFTGYPSQPPPQFVQPQQLPPQQYNMYPPTMPSAMRSQPPPVLQQSYQQNFYDQQ